jgi:hypothetical protein
MQVVMWMVFAGALGLAQLVVRQRQLAPIVLDAPVRLGPLSVRLPKGWIISAGQDSLGNGIQVHDPDDSRDMVIVVERVQDGQQGGQDLDQPGAGTQPIFFRGLSRPGVIVELPRKKVATADGTMTTEEVMCALTDLPSGHEVEIVLRQFGTKMGAAERQLIETVANEITWAGPLPPTRRLPPLPRGPVL